MEDSKKEPSTQEAKPKKKMRMWKKVLIGIGVFILLVIMLAMFATSGIVNVAEKQLKLIQSGDMKGAYSLTSLDFQKSVSYDNFLAYVNNYEVLKNNKSHNFSSRETSGDTGTIQGTLTAKDGTASPIEYKFVKEGGDWKILSLNLKPSAGTGAEAGASSNASSGANTGAGANTNAGSQSSTGTSGSMNNFSDPALGYSIQYPKDWTMEKKDAVTVLFRGPSASGMSDITLDIQNLQSSNRGGKYTDNGDVVKDLKNKLKDMDKNVTINDIPDIAMKRSDGMDLTGKSFAAKLTAQGKKYVFMYIVVPHGDGLTFHTLEFMSPVDQFDKYSDLLKSILNTWQISK